MLKNILTAFGLNADDYSITPFGSGLINSTWKVAAEKDSYILQRINTSIFKTPLAIANNLENLKAYLLKTKPGYIFVAPLATTDGRLMVFVNGQYYRLLPFVKNSHTVNAVSNADEAYEAAKQFAKFSRLLNDFDAATLAYTLPDFHNLGLRINQFQSVLKAAEVGRLEQAANEIELVHQYATIADTYQQIVNNPAIPLRVIHHDTKINNVLFDEKSKGICVIDLDTVMPGYFISDVGDMMRTYLSPANEEEQDLKKIYVRKENLAAIYNGYMEEMSDILTDTEKGLFYYSGSFMIYMQAVRFLTDYLNGDVYYHTTYPGQNLARAQNQLELLSRYMQAIET